MEHALPVIVNAAAGGGRGDDEIAALEHAFAEAGARPTIVRPASGAEIAPTARRLAEAGHPAIVAAGGDGTVSAVAGAIAGTQSALGVIPLGTLNHFARNLGIPTDVDAAAKAIVGGSVKSIDVGEVNGRIFVNNSSIGLYPTFVLHRRRQERLGRDRWHAFAWAVLRTMERYPLLDLRLSIEGAAVRRRAPLVFVGNNAYGMEGFHVGRRERLDEGRLCIYVTQRQTRLGLFGLALRALVGFIHQARDFEALSAERVTIDSRHNRLAVSTDGEVAILDMPLEYAIRPGALRVLMPPAS